MQVRVFATLRPLVGGPAIELSWHPGMTVRDLLDAIVGEHPALAARLLTEDGRLNPQVHLFVNGRDSPLLPSGLDTELAATDHVAVFP